MTPISRLAPFIAPFLVFMLFLSIEGYLPGEHYVLYPIKTLLVVLVLAYYWRVLPSLRPARSLVSGLVGVLGVVLWVGLDPFSIWLNGMLSEWMNAVTSPWGLTSWHVTPEWVHPAGRDPFQLYSPPEARALFTLRVLGIALCVPIMEELFWRGFLMRWLIREDFEAVPLGTYRPFSFAVTTLCFASVHGTEWPLGLIVGTLYGVWFVTTKSLGSVMLAHGVTNFLLALYCLYSDDWHFLSTMAVTAAPK